MTDSIHPSMLGFTELDLDNHQEKWENKATTHQENKRKSPFDDVPKEDNDFLGMSTIGKSLWAVIELPSQLLGCAPDTSPRKQRKHRVDPEELEETFYEASSIDWAIVTCPSSGENRIAKFDANVVFAYTGHATMQKLSSASNTFITPSEKSSFRHIICYASGRINTLDFEGNTAIPPRELPASIAGLSDLVCLRLHNENLRGSLPLSNLASRLVHLEVLDLSSNNFEGEIDGSQLACLTRLEVLNLSHNALTGLLPATIGLLTALEALILNHNQLSGAIPSTLQSLPRLHYVDLQSNNFLPGLSAEDARTTIVSLLPKNCEFYI